jgi:hypothetical protein
MDLTKKNIKHLKIDLISMFYANEQRHVLEVMKELGITCQYRTPQPISDSWWFWNCENIPEALPDYIKELIADPMECIGFGLSEEMAIQIRDYKNN